MTFSAADSILCSKNKPSRALNSAKQHVLPATPPPLVEMRTNSGSKYKTIKGEEDNAPPVILPPPAVAEDNELAESAATLAIPPMTECKSDTCSVVIFALNLIVNFVECKPDDNGGSKQGDVDH